MKASVDATESSPRLQPWAESLKKSSPGRAAEMRALVSNDTLWLPEFLTLFVNSCAGQIQVEGKTTGGVQTNLTIPAIESIQIPVGPIKWQTGFVEIIERALTARARARELLDRAERAVEIAIEQDEKAATKFLG